MQCSFMRNLISLLFLLFMTLVVIGVHWQILSFVRLTIGNIVILLYIFIYIQNNFINNYLSSFVYAVVCLIEKRQYKYFICLYVLFSIFEGFKIVAYYSIKVNIFNVFINWWIWTHLMGFNSLQLLFLMSSNSVVFDSRKLFRLVF